jgi:malate dehydrogenase (oxaloacetate-decarboxylating)
MRLADALGSALTFPPDDADAGPLPPPADGQQILGLGDQGTGGILISSAKLALATICAGVHPGRVLPVMLDCGTDNDALLRDDMYLGLRRQRAVGDEYDAFVDEFVAAARELFPAAYIHFEDFGFANGECLAGESVS